MKKLVSLLLAMILVISSGAIFMGCNKDNSTVTEILLLNFDGGVGSEWLDDDIKVFTEMVRENSYEKGKTGVKFRVDKTMTLSPNSMNTTGYNIYFDEGATNIRALSAAGKLVDLNELVTTDLTEYGEDKSIIEKVDATYRSKLKGLDGHYYGLPYYEWYPGIVFDPENFKQYDLYIAQDGAVGVETVNRYGQPVNFVKNTRIDSNMSKLSVGNDGVPGTSDDGLPTTLVELLSLCYRMDDKSIIPLQSTGMDLKYTNYLLEGIWASLAGYDKMRANYTLSYKNLEVVKRDTQGNIVFTDQPLFTGLEGVGNDGDGEKVTGNYILKPETELIDLTSENGYRYYDMVERYYAIAFLEIAHREGWFSEDAESSSVSHTDAQENFIFNGKNVMNVTKKRYGMLIEGTYWYRESLRSGAFGDYTRLATDEYENPNKKELGWMSLPTALGLNASDKVTGTANAREVALLETSQSFVTLNKASFRGRPGVLDACLDFIKFMYSDARLSAFTKNTGIAKGGMTYNLLPDDEASLEDFQKSVWNLRASGKVVLAGSDDATYLEKQERLDIRSLQSLWEVKFGNKNYGTYIQALRTDSTKKVNAKTIFDATCKTSSNW